MLDAGLKQTLVDTGLDDNVVIIRKGAGIEVQSGVGCAWAMISAALKGKDMDSGECSCGGDEGTCCGAQEGKSSCCEEK